MVLDALLITSISMCTVSDSNRFQDGNGMLDCWTRDSLVAWAARSRGTAGPPSVVRKWKCSAPRDSASSEALARGCSSSGAALWRTRPKRSPQIYTKSAQRLRRWSNIVWMLYKCFVFTGITFKTKQYRRPTTHMAYHKAYLWIWKGFNGIGLHHLF